MLCKKHPGKTFQSSSNQSIVGTFTNIFTQHQQAPTQVSVLLDHSSLSGFSEQICPNICKESYWQVSYAL